MKNKETYLSKNFTSISKRFCPHCAMSKRYTVKYFDIYFVDQIWGCQIVDMSGYTPYQASCHGFCLKKNLRNLFKGRSYQRTQSITWLLQYYLVHTITCSIIQSGLSYHNLRFFQMSTTMTSSQKYLVRFIFTVQGVQTCEVLYECIKFM